MHVSFFDDIVFHNFVLDQSIPRLRISSQSKKGDEPWPLPVSFAPSRPLALSVHILESGNPELGHKVSPAEGTGSELKAYDQIRRPHDLPMRPLLPKIGRIRLPTGYDLAYANRVLPACHGHLFGYSRMISHPVHSKWASVERSTCNDTNWASSIQASGVQNIRVTGSPRTPKHDTVGPTADRTRYGRRISFQTFQAAATLAATRALLVL